MKHGDIKDSIPGSESPGHDSEIIVDRIILRRICLPLIEPYRLSYHTFDMFEPIIVEVHGSDGKMGWGDGHISPGSSDETRAGGWGFGQEIASTVVGLETNAAISAIANRLHESKVAGSALTVALEMLEQSSLLDVPEDIDLPLLAPVNGLNEVELEPELEAKMADGFKTFKIKVGKDVDADLARLALVQKLTAGRATLRIDANRAFERDQGIKFASSIDPTGVELFEQPCAAEDWDANGTVAEHSTVPLMLDEPICGLADIEKAAGMKGVGLCKLKLKRFGSLSCLKQGLDLVRNLGMDAVLGDGLGSELTGWMEAAVAQTSISNAGEFNGFLKVSGRLFKNPLKFENGNLSLPKGFVPSLNQRRLEDLTIEVAEFQAI